MMAIYHKKSEDLFEDEELYKPIPIARRKRYRQISEDSSQGSSSSSQGSYDEISNSSSSSQESIGEGSSKKEKLLTLWLQTRVQNVMSSDTYTEEELKKATVKQLQLIIQSHELETPKLRSDMIKLLEGLTKLPSDPQIGELVKEHIIYAKVKRCVLLFGTEIAGVAQDPKTGKKFKFTLDALRDKLVIQGILSDKIAWKPNKKKPVKSLIHPDAKRNFAKGCKLTPEEEAEITEPDVKDSKPESDVKDINKNQNKKILPLVMTKGKIPKKKDIFV